MFEQGLLPLLEEAWSLKSRRSLNFFRFLFNDSGFRSHLILNIIIEKTFDKRDRFDRKDCDERLQFGDEICTSVIFESNKKGRNM